MRNSKKDLKIPNFSGCETVKPVPPNIINGLQQKISQFHSFCETVKLWSWPPRSYFFSGFLAK